LWVKATLHHAIPWTSIIASTQQFEPLPTPSDLPDAHVVIFDGKCVFCQKQVRNLRKFDGGDRLAFVSLHDPLVAERYPDLTYDQMMDQLYLIPSKSSGRSDQRYGGAEAVAYLTTQFPRLWLLAPILNFPFLMPVWQFFYRLVANRRYKIAGKQPDACDPDGTCDLHFKK
jgi:predicted DCC family thiol-disulfide oxidoreductase YuxK